MATVRGRRLVAGVAASSLAVAVLAVAVHRTTPGGHVALTPAVPTIPSTSTTMSASPPPPSPATTTTAAPAAPPPRLSWSACDGDRQCATLDVALDHAAPAGPHIAIALERRAASDPARRLGSLVLNPGGPGESGIHNLAKDLSVLPEGVTGRFDVVAFDPRGIGQSSPVHCSAVPAATAATTPAPDPIPATAAAQQAMLQADADYAQGCAHYSGALLLAHVGTLDVARDLEDLRVAMGEGGLNFLGLSYGTLLGVTYADLFPTQVRAMVLDGMYDPSLSTDEITDAQAGGFESSLQAFLGWCASMAGGCGWQPGSEDPLQAFRALQSQIHQHPIGRLGLAEFSTAIFGTLYARSWWPSLGRALGAVSRGDPGPLLALYDSYQRAADPSFSVDDNSAVTCLDHPVSRDLATYPGRAQAAAAKAPDFGAIFAWDELACAPWPVDPSLARTPHVVQAPGSGPILVVGTRGDPATPYSWAVSVAGHLQRGRLLTREGVDHVAIFYSACVRDADEHVLVDLSLPAPGAICAG